LLAAGWGARLCRSKYFEVRASFDWMRRRKERGVSLLGLRAGTDKGATAHTRERGGRDDFANNLGSGD
jgi:hypothetical protein